MTPAASPPSAGAGPPGRQERSLLGLVFLATVMIGLNATMMNVALPGVADDLDATAGQSGWILLVYLLLSTGLLVPLGHVADVVDRRRLFLVGLVLFASSAVGIGVAPTASWVIVLRGSQAVGASILLASAAVIVAAVFPGVRLGRAMGVYLAGFSTGQVAGPLVGGVITTLLGWRWLFWVNVPLGLTAVLWGWRALRAVPSPRDRPPLRVDAVGSVALLTGLGCLLMALSRVPYLGWADPFVVANLVATAVVLLPLPWWFRRTADPAIDTTLFRDREFTVAVLSSCALIVPRLVTGVLMALYVQGVRGGSALGAAVLVAPLAVAVTVSSLLAGVLTRGRPDRSVALGAIAVTALGSAVLVAAMSPGSGVPLQLVGIVLVGLGTGVFGAVNSSMIMRFATSARAGRTNGVRMLATNASFAVGTAVALSIVTAGLSGSSAQAFFAGRTELLTPSDLTSLVAGYRVAFAVIVATVLAAGWATWTTIDARSGARNGTLARGVVRP